MKIGTKVTNERGWTGTVVERPKHWQWKSGPLPVVYVYWKEREEMMLSKDRGDHNIKDPVISAKIEDLIILS